MLQVNHVTNKKSFGEKTVSFLRYPLFTITLQSPVQRNYKVKKKPEILKPAKTVMQKKTVKRKSAVLNNMPHKIIPERRKSVPFVFSLAQNKEEYDKLLFVIRVCDKSNNRMFTNVLHIERISNGSRLTATDGKRMHVTEIKTRVKPGDYKPIVSKDTIRLGAAVPNINFPNWERAVPVNVTRRGCIAIDNKFINENSSIYNSFTKMTGEKVNPKYLSDLAGNTWEVYCQSEKRKAVLLKQYGVKETYAVIMPLS